MARTKQTKSRKVKGSMRRNKNLRKKTLRNARKMRGGVEVTPSVSNGESDNANQDISKEDLENANEWMQSVEGENVIKNAIYWMSEVPDTTDTYWKDAKIKEFRTYLNELIESFKKNDVNVIDNVSTPNDGLIKYKVRKFIDTLVETRKEYKGMTDIPENAKDETDKNRSKNETEFETINTKFAKEKLDLQKFIKTQGDPTSIKMEKTMFCNLSYLVFYNFLLYLNKQNRTLIIDFANYNLEFKVEKMKVFLQVKFKSLTPDYGDELMNIAGLFNTIDNQKVDNISIKHVGVKTLLRQQKYTIISLKNKDKTQKTNEIIKDEILSIINKNKTDNKNTKVPDLIIEPNFKFEYELVVSFMPGGFKQLLMKKKEKDSDTHIHYHVYDTKIDILFAFLFGEKGVEHVNDKRVIEIIEKYKKADEKALEAAKEKINMLNQKLDHYRHKLVNISYEIYCKMFKTQLLKSEVNGICQERKTTQLPGSGKSSGNSYSVGTLF